MALAQSELVGERLPFMVCGSLGAFVVPAENCVLGSTGRAGRTQGWAPHSDSSIQ